MIKYCKCGCGKEIVIKPHHKYYGIPDYCPGHNASISVNNPEVLGERSRQWKENNPMKNPIIAKKNALKRKGKRRTKEQKENISIGVKESLKRPEIKEKMKKPKTKNHKKKLRIASMGNQSAKGTNRSEAFKENCKKTMMGNQNAQGKRSKKTKKNNSRASKKNWENPEYRKKRLNALHKHHIYLDEDDEKTLMLTSSKHLQLHSKAYDYLVKIDKVDGYIRWFDEKYNLFKKKGGKI